jgi:lysophospholipase L1-like esterase
VTNKFVTTWLFSEEDFMNFSAMLTTSNQSVKRRLSVILTLLCLAVIALGAVLLRLPAASALGGQDPAPQAVGGVTVTTWGASPQSAAEQNATPMQFNNQTIRTIARISKGGDQVRVQLSNVFGTGPLQIGAASLARHVSGAQIDTNTNRTLLFGGQGSVSIPAGASVVSDPVFLQTPDLAELAVSVWLPNSTSARTVHSFSAQTTFISPSGMGNITEIASLPIGSTSQSRFFVTSIDVRASTATRAIVTIGDSITEGVGSTGDANRRWPDRLAERLISNNFDRTVVNEGIGGNRLLADVVGPSVLSRFDRDVLTQSSVGFVVVLIGVNDLGFGQNVTLDGMLQGYRQLTARAHMRGLKIYLATILPYEGSFYFNSAREVIREQINTAIRNNSLDADGFFDFESVIRNPSRPTTYLPQFDSGDHLHPNDAGYQAMANSMDLTKFNDSVPTPTPTPTPIAANFTLSANPSNLTINQGASGMSTITITRTGGFSSSVTLSASGLPSGVTATFNPASTSTTGTSSALTLTVSSAATAGMTSIAITGAGGGLTRTTTVILTVAGGGGGTGGVTITPVINSSGPFFGEEALRLANTGAITSLSITITVQRTTGVGFNGQYNTVGGQILQSNSVTAATITYQFTLAAGQTLGPGTNYLFAAQTTGTGTIHPTTGDTYTVTYTTGGASFTQTGHF